jgi:hypothetical protein
MKVVKHILPVPKLLPKVIESITERKPPTISIGRVSHRAPGGEHE